MDISLKMHRAQRSSLLTIILLASLLIPGLAQADECFQMVEKADLKPQIINGKEVYVVDPDAVITDCNLYQKAREAALKARNQNEKLLATIDELNSKYKDLYDAKESYYALVLRYEGVLNQSSDLVEGFESHAGKWASLQQKYARLVEDYNKLSDDYRAIAMNFSTPLAFDVGGGVTEEEGFAGLVGVRVHRFGVWGFLQKDNSGVMATYSFPWSKL